MEAVDSGAAEIGARLARYRRAADLDQDELALAAGVSVSLLRKIEQGRRRLTQPLAEALAVLLKVPVDELAGIAAARHSALGAHAAIPAIHGALARFDVPLPPEHPPRPLRELRAAVDEVSVLRNAGRYVRLGGVLPELIDELTYAAHSRADPERCEVLRLLILTYFAAHAMSYKLGYDHLATLAEERIAWASAQTEDPLLCALAAWTRCTTFLATGGPSLKAGLSLLDDARHRLDPLLTRPDAQLLSVYGALHLRQAVLAARDRQPALAAAHLAENRTLIERGALDTNPRSLLTAGPVNSRIVAVAVAVELGDAPTALARARHLRIPGDFSRVRAAHHHVDLARAQLWNGARAQALSSLLTAEQLAAAQTRHHPATGQVLRTLASLHGTRTKPQAMRSLLERIKRSGAPNPLA